MPMNKMNKANAKGMAGMVKAKEKGAKGMAKAGYAKGGAVKKKGKK